MTLYIYIILHALEYTEKINILQYNSNYSKHLGPKNQASNYVISNQPIFSLHTYLFLVGLSPNIMMKAVIFVSLN
jgi:hypothetical protein